MRAPYAILLPILLLAVACEPDTECREQISVAACVTVEQQRGDSLDTRFLTQWDSITIQGLGNDSILYNHSTNVQRLALPLREDTTLTAYLFRWHSLCDTLYIQHTPRNYFISMACGCTIYHTIDSVWATGNYIHEVQIINAAVERYEQENIRLTLPPKESNE